MRIVTENLSYSYGTKQGKVLKKALKGVSLTVEEGEFFGIVGHTGSGKTTFVQHLNGLIKLQKNSGSVKIGEFDLSGKTDFKSLRAKVGMVFQYPEYQLFAETVFGDVAFGLKNFFPDITAEDLEERVKEAIIAVGLDYAEIKDKSPFDLSGGQKRRVAIAGVIVSRPEVLVLDEPAAGLDPKGKSEFIALLHALNKDFVKTVIIVSHDMNLISENCTKVAVFTEGEIIKTGTPEEVFTEETVAESGLELPVVAYLKQKLKEKGVDVGGGITVKEFADGVARLYGGKK